LVKQRFGITATAATAVENPMALRTDLANNGR
jgi:hypothetical protein